MREKPAQGRCREAASCEMTVSAVTHRRPAWLTRTKPALASAADMLAPPGGSHTSSGPRPCGAKAEMARSPAQQGTEPRHNVEHTTWIDLQMRTISQPRVPRAKAWI